MFGSVGPFGFGLHFFIRDATEQAIAKIKRNINSLRKTTQDASKVIMSEFGKIGAGFGKLALASAAIIAPFIGVLSQSAALSDALADVTKTTNIAGDQLQELRKDLQAIDTRTSVTALLQIAKAGGSLGIAQKDIFGFTEAVDKLNVALGDQFPSPEQLARELAQLRLQLQDIKTDDVSADLLRVGNVLNFMGANAQTTEVQIVDSVSRMAGQMQALGATTSELFGLNTAILETGAVSSEVLGTNLPLIVKQMTKEYEKFAAAAGINSEVFRKQVNEGPIEALIMFSKGLKAAGLDNVAMSRTLQQLGLTGGRTGAVISAIGTNLDGVNRRIKEAGLALQNTDSILGEFNAKNENFAAIVEKGRKQLQILATTIGDALVPIATVIINAFTAMAKVMTVIAENPIGKFLIRLSAIIAIVTVTLLTMNFAVNVLIPSLKIIATTAFGLGKTLLTTVVPSLGATAAGVWAVIAPLLPIIGIIAAVIAIFVGLSKAMNSSNEKVSALAVTLGFFLGPLTAVMSMVTIVKRGVQEFQKVLAGGEVRTGFLGFLQKVGGIITGVIEIFRSVSSEGFSMSRNVFEALEKLGVADFVIALGTWIVRIREFLKGMKMAFVETFAPIGALWRELVNSFKTAFGPILDEFVSIFDLIGFEMDKNTSSMETWLTVGKTVFKVLTLSLQPLLFMIRGVLKTITLVIDGFNALRNVGESIGGFIKNLFGGDDNEPQAVATPAGGPGRLRLPADRLLSPQGMQRFQRQQAQTRAMQIINERQDNATTQTTEVLKSVNLQIDLDGETIAKKVTDVIEQEGDRS